MELSVIIGFLLFLLFLKVRKLEQQNERLERALKALAQGEMPMREAKASSRSSQSVQLDDKKISTPELVGDWPNADITSPLAAGMSGASALQQNFALPRKFVFSGEKITAAINFVKANWFYLIAAISLAFAGIFFIQYGIENGLLPPKARVVFALLFGACLIGGGEWLRRKGGDEADDLNAFLPSIFAGAGIITLFAAILGARQLYGLIDVELAFFGLIAIAGLAIFIGWHYGALLTLIGLIGATATPFIVGGESETIHLLYVYFALIAAIGLSVDALKRSAFVSATALIAPSIGAILLYLSDPSTAIFFIFYGFAAVLMALFLPSIPNRPVHEGGMALYGLHKLGPKALPDFPERLATGAITLLLVIIAGTHNQNALAFWSAILALGALIAIATFVLRRSPALDDLVMVLYLAIPTLLIVHGAADGVAAKLYTNDAMRHLNPSPMGITYLVSLGIVGSLAGAWRSIRNTHFPLIWSFAGAAFAPLIALAIGLFWHPMWLYSATEWAFHLAAIAMALTYVAFCFQKWFAPEDPRSAIFAFGALAMLGYAVSVILTETALTLTLAGITLLTALLDRRYNMRLLTFGVQLGAAIVSFRLIVNPGLFWAYDAALWELGLGFIGSMMFLAAAWLLMRERARIGAMITLESAIVALMGIFISVLLFRFFNYMRADMSTHIYGALFGIIWLLGAATQLYRLKPQALVDMPRFVRWVRIGLASLLGSMGLLILTANLTVLSPLENGRVLGWPIINSLAIGYLLPALVIAAAVYYFDHLGYKFRLFLAAIATLLLVVFIGLEIRHLWQGADMRQRNGVMDSELYSYTIAMLLAGAGLLITALYRRSDILRKIGLVVIGLTIAKVFFVDMSGLTGLTRIFSFLALGLVLAGLAWLNRWMIMRDAASDRRA